MIKLPYKHPLMGWYFHYGPVLLIDGSLHIGELAIHWQERTHKLWWKPRKIQIWSDEPAMYQWLKFNISFHGGWGIGLAYNADHYSTRLSHGN